MKWINVIRKLSDLDPWERNPRQINVKQAERLKESFEEFGQVETIAIGPNNEIYNGHQRLNVLMDQHGGEYEVECRQLDRELTEKEREKLTVFLHKGAAGDWDWDILANEFEFEDLIDWGFSEGELIGFDKDPPEAPEPRIDEAEELREKWGVESGQLWQLGEHRVICGDCTDSEVINKIGITNDMPVFTDPPYGINYDPSWLDDVGTHRQALSSRDTIKNDDGSLDLIFLFNHPRRFIWGFPYIYDKEATGWIVWDKQPGVEGRGIVTPIEMASTTMRKGFDMVRVMWGGYYRASGEDKQPHPTQKPISTVQPFIDKWTKQNEIVVDYFIGSGSVLIACERLNRKCYGVEIEPKYVAVTIERWHEMTGEEPVLLDSLDS